MAITRAQQFKQMLREGGRIGFQGGGRDLGAGATGMGSGQKRDTGSDYGQFDRAVSRSQNNPNRTTTSSSRDDDNKVDVGFQEALRKQKIKQKQKTAQEAGFRTSASTRYVPPSKFQQFKNKRFQNAINRNKVAALRELGLMDPKSFNLAAALFQGFEELPEMYQDLTEQEINDLAMEINKMKQYSGGTLSMPTVSGVMKSGQDLLGKVFEAQDLLDQNKLTQDKFQDLFPGPPKPREDEKAPSDPCLGPNPPAYCFIGEKAEETIEAQRNLGGLPARITGSLFDFTGMADGGRIGAMGGGMMDLDSARQMMFLGGIAKSISKGLKGVTRAAKKVFKSPVGKAALLGLGAYYAPGIGIKATGGFSNLTQPGGFLSTLLTKGGDKALNLDNLSGLKIAGLLTAAPFLFSSDEEEEDKPTDMGPTLTMEELLAIRANPFKYLTPRIAGSQFAAEGGRIGYQKGSKEPVAKKVMPLLDMGGKEMDLRDNGGFVPIGRMEKADDVPARLSKNEFVFTADAVRNAGDGDVDKGAEVMYNMMKNLERGGNVSEESQGLEGAREMFQTAQRLGEVV